MLFWVQITLLCCAILVLARVAVNDWRQLRIANIDVLILLALALGLAWIRLMAMDETWFELSVRLVVTLVTFTLLFVFWMTGGFGAGDAKLVPTCVLLVSSASWVWFAVGLVVCTFLIVPFIRFFPANATAPARKKSEGMRQLRVLPYGTVVGPATILALSHEIYQKFFVFGHGILNQL